MILLTKEIEARFAKVGSQEGSKNPTVIAKFFNPCGSATWYATEYIPEEKMFFGYVNLFGGDDAEWGYFLLEELKEIRLPFGMGIERDLYCGEKPIGDFEPKALRIFQ